MALCLINGKLQVCSKYVVDHVSNFGDTCSHEEEASWYGGITIGLTVFKAPTIGQW